MHHLDYEQVCAYTRIMPLYTQSSLRFEPAYLQINTTGYYHPLLITKIPPSSSKLWEAAGFGLWDHW